MLNSYLDTPDEDDLDNDLQPDDQDDPLEPESGQDIASEEVDQPRRGNPAVALRQERELRRKAEKRAQELESEKQRWDAYQRHSQQPQQDPNLIRAQVEQKLQQAMEGEHPLASFYELATSAAEQRALERLNSHFQQQYGWLNEEGASRQAKKVTEALLQERPEYAYLAEAPSFQSKLTEALQYAEDPKATAEWLASVYHDATQIARGQQPRPSRMGSVVGNNTRRPKSGSGLPDNVMGMRFHELQAALLKDS
jgi:hypothetical protein